MLERCSPKVRGREGTGDGLLLSSSLWIKRKSYEGEKVRKRKSPEMGFFVELTRRRKSGSEMRESQCLETDLNLRRDFMGRKSRIWIRRSTLLAIVSADFMVFEVAVRNRLVGFMVGVE